MERLVPQSIEAEKGVLGSILIDPEVYDLVVDQVKTEDFYRNEHRMIYKTLVSLVAQDMVPDYLTLCEELEREDKLEKVGGTDYITSLIGEVPTSGNAEYYAQIVARTAINRRLVHAAGMIAQLAYDQDSKSLEKSEQLLYDLQKDRVSKAFTDMPEMVSEYMAELDYLSDHKGTCMGVPTGYGDIDRMLGGFQKSDLILLGGRPGSGKTSLGLCIAYNAALSGKKVAVFSLEMGKKQLTLRMMSMASKVDMQRLRSGFVEDDEWDTITQKAQDLSKLPISVNDTAGNAIASMRSQYRRLFQEKNGIDLVIVDYLGLIAPDEARSNDNRVNEISKISWGLKKMAKDFDIPVLALAQLSRAVENRSSKTPQLSDLRDSGCLTGDSQIYLPHDGIYKRIDSLVGQSGFDVLALNDKTWKLEPRKVMNAFATGRKTVYKLTTQLGRTIRATANHKFLAFSGWRQLDEFEVGMHIALPRELPGPMIETMSDAELGLLGHLIGDGCTLPRHSIQYTTVDQDLAEMVAGLTTQVFGDRVAPRINWEAPKSKKGGWYQVYLPAAFRLTHGKCNPIAEWLRGMDAFGFRSYEKFVPQRVFTQSNEGIATFLKHLWATDGTAFCTDTRAIPTISYASSSIQLAQDVQSLLLRLSIISRVSCVPQGNKGRYQYHVNISGKENQERFINLVGIVGDRKKALLDQVRQHLSTRTGNTNLDVIPSLAWRQLVVPAMATISMTARQMQAGIGKAYNGTSLYRNGMGRERAMCIASVVQCQQLALLAQSDVYWDTIASIEPDGEEEVYDLTVEGHHNFVANNIVVHNSLEQDADIVMFIHREDYYAQQDGRKDYTPTNLADITVAKHRNGPTGAVQLFFQADQTMFYNLEHALERKDKNNATEE